MKVYFACSITGGREQESVYQIIVNAMQADGHVVPTASIADPEVIALEDVAEPVEVYSRAVQWVEESDALVAEVTTPSHGVGYEIAYALNLGKPVLCCYRHGSPVSKMITGNTRPTLQVRGYHTAEEAGVIARGFLNALSA